MWKCPACETINNGESCVICGEPRPAGAKVNAPAPPQYVPHSTPSVHSTYKPIKAEPLEPAAKLTAKPVTPVSKFKTNPDDQEGSSVGLVILGIVVAAIIGFLLYAALQNTSYACSDGSYYSEATESTPYYKYIDGAGEIIEACEYTED